MSLYLNRSFHLKIFIIITLFFCHHSSILLAAPASASDFNATNSYFRTIDIKSGLPDNSINDIAEDKYGFIWIASWNGLGRYDGVKVQNFYKDNDSGSNSLSSNMVRSLLPVDNGLWVATDNGLDYYKFSNGKFLHSYLADDSGALSLIKSRVSRLAKTESKIFGITSSGDLICHDNRFTSDGSPIFQKVTNSKGNRFADITNYTRGRLLALTERGVSLLTEDGKKELYRFPVNSGYDLKMNIACDTLTGRIYLGYGIGHKSLALKINNKTNQISHDASAFVPGGLMKTTILNGSVFFSTDGEGLWVQNPNGGIYNYTMENSSLPGNVIYTSFADSSNNLWVGTYRRGMALLSHQLNWFDFATTANQNIPYDIVTAVHPFKGKIYLGLDGGGLAEYNPATKTSIHYSASNSSLPGNNVVSISDDGEKLWLGIYTRGIASFDPDNKQFTHYPLTPSQEPDNTVWTILCDTYGHLWIGGKNLNILDIATGEITTPSEFKDARISSMALNGNNIWIGSTAQGLMKFDTKSLSLLLHASSSHKSDAIRLPSYDISQIFIDTKGNLWLTLPSKGLARINPNTDDDPAIFGPRQGLFDIRVRSIVEDRQGHLWLGTQNGLFRYNPENSSFIKIEDPRLPMIFNQSAAALVGTDIYMGTTEGVVEFSPSTKMFSPITGAQLHFTSLDILGPKRESISLYSTPLTQLTLSHDQNFFTIHFAVPDLVYPGRVRYSYRLRGLDKEWSEPSESMSAEYTSVPPGIYTFEVRHTLPDGSWSEPSSFPMKILPPWWQTWWATVLAVLLVIGIIGIVVYFWHQHFLSRQRLEIALIEKESEHKLHNAKLDFFAKISHELRTSVFIINAQVEELLAAGKETITIRKSHLDSICRNSVKLNKLVNRIIDFRKLDLGRDTLKFTRGDIVVFLRSLADDYDYLLQQKDITFLFNAPSAPIISMYDPDCLDLIVSNLISNAYKYTRPGGSVTLSVSSRDKKVIIKVKDTGIGVNEQLQKEIFTPYYRTESGQAESGGDGIGLAYVKELVELHKGSISVSSQEGIGSVFIVEFPIIDNKDKIASTNDLPAIDNPSSQNIKKSGMQPEPGRRKYTSDSATQTSPNRKYKTSLPQPQNPTASNSVMIVEDDPEITKLLVNTFAPDFKIYTAGNGKEALKKMEKILPDVVLTDIDMPGMDGHALIRHIQENPELKHIRIVVLTAINNEEEMMKALDEGACAYFTKPISLRVLAKHISGIINRKATTSLTFNTGKNVRTSSSSDSSVNNTTESSADTYLHPHRLNDEEKKFLIHCRRIIDDNLRNPLFDIEFMTEELNMSHSTLYKKIKKLTGMGLLEFITDYRLCRAVELFREGNSNVQRVSEMVGYKDTKSFRTVFKKKMGVSPKQYVQSL